MAKQVYSGVGDFPTYYRLLRCHQGALGPIISVRQAWSHAIDRDALIASILGPRGVAGLFVAGSRIPGLQCAKG